MASGALQRGAFSSAEGDGAADGRAHSNANDPLQVERIVVEKGRLACYVVVPNPKHRFTDDALAQTVVKRFPDLMVHSCVNATSRQFSTVINNTSVPHLLEHIAIDIQVHKAQHGDTFVGATEWVDEKQGRALVQLSFVDDLEALSALKEALVFLNDALVQRG